MAQTMPLLDRLRATVEDEAVFDLADVVDPEEFRAELREAWDAAYATAVYCWNDMLEVDCDMPALFGERMCARFEALSSDWLDSFREGIESVAAQDDLPEEDDREFLWFMLGTLRMSFWTHLLTRRRESEAGTS
jgi:hypothetical protein